MKTTCFYLCLATFCLISVFSCSLRDRKKEKKRIDAVAQANKKATDSALLEQFRISITLYHRRQMQRHFITDSFTLKGEDSDFVFNTKSADHTENTQIILVKNDSGEIDTVAPGLNLRAHERQFAQKVVFKFYSKDLVQPYNDKEETIADFFFANADWYLLDNRGLFYRYSAFLTTGDGKLEFTSASPADSIDVVRKSTPRLNYSTIEGYVIFKIRKDCLPTKVVYALGRGVHLASDLLETDDWGVVIKDRIRGFSVGLHKPASAAQ